MPNFMPAVAPDIFALRPDFRAVSIHASGLRNVASHPEALRRLAAACAAPCGEAWAEAHREAWREAYRSFGAKPQRTPCSAEALFKRVQRDGTMPGINAVVDLYNAVSLLYAVPVGGENAAAYVGAPRLIRAAGHEVFDTVQAGTTISEHPETGEAVWCDDLGVTCRRWNWRQGVRTRIDESTTAFWFVLEALGPMPEEALMRATDDLVAALRLLSPHSNIIGARIAREGSSVLF